MKTKINCLNKPKSYGFSGLLLLTLLTGCAGSVAQTRTAHEDINIGSTLVLNDTIRFPPNSASIDIQNGQVRSGLFSIDKYNPNCTLELRSQSNDTRLIRPDRFTIYRINFNIEQVLNQPVMVAGFGFHMADGSTDDIYITRLYLQSETQKEVELMTCQHWEDPTNFPDYLTRQQIQQTLGGLFTLEAN